MQANAVCGAHLSAEDLVLGLRSMTQCVVFRIFPHDVNSTINRVARRDSSILSKCRNPGTKLLNSAILDTKRQLHRNHES